MYRTIVCGQATEWNTELEFRKTNITRATFFVFSANLVTIRSAVMNWDYLIIVTGDFFRFKDRAHRRNRFRKSMENRSTWDPFHLCSTVRGSAPPRRSHIGSYWVHRRSNWWKLMDDQSTTRKSFLLRPGPCPMSRNAHCQNLFLNSSAIIFMAQTRFLLFLHSTLGLLSQRLSPGKTGKKFWNSVLERWIF